MGNFQEFSRSHNKKKLEKVETLKKPLWCVT